MSARIMYPGTLVLVAVTACGGSAGPRAAPPAASLAVRKMSAEPSLTGSRIAATTTGAIVIDADSGTLLAVDHDAKVLATRAIGRGAGLLVYDPVDHKAYVADRLGDRLVVVDVRDGLRVVNAWRTPREPFGIALTPDRATVLVTTVADHALVAFDTRTGEQRWRSTLSSGARGVSVSPSGELALVSTIANGWLDLVELQGDHRVASIPYDLACERCQDSGAFARGTGAVQFIDRNRAIATYQRSNPEALIDRSTGRYGGGSHPPVTQHVAVFTFSTDPANPGVSQRVARIADHQPRSLVFDEARDTTWVAGLGSDTLLELAGFSTRTDGELEDAASSFALRATGRCGPDGAALTNAGDLLVWCSFTRSLLRLHAGALRESPPLVATAMSPTEHRGFVLFYSTTSAINRDGALACASCHLDGGSDGLAWQIGSHALQTPILAGRLAGTQPYKWDGSDPTLDASIATTVRRLGGTGLTTDQKEALIAYLLSLAPPRAPTCDAAAIARGKLVFEGPGGCVDCHHGPSYSDGDRHALSPTFPAVDTPSLIGLASSAPYYHDGSAATLGDLVAGGGTIRNMGELSSLTEDQRADLRAFLESL